MVRSACIALGVVLLFLIGSCGKSACLNPGFRVALSGFDSGDFSRILIEQYTSNSNFATLINVRVYDTVDSQTWQSGDTLYMPRVDTAGIYIAPGYDYIVSMPNVRHSFFADSSFKISMLSYHQVSPKTSKGSNGGCTNDAYYYLDSMPYKTTGVVFGQSNLPSVNIILNK